MVMRTLVLLMLVFSGLKADFMLVPMDLKQADHLKAYGVAYWILTHNTNVEWLLNYRGGSFLFPETSLFENECRLRGVYFETVPTDQVNAIYAAIEENNMDRILLEKAPLIAVYTPPGSQPWDDAVTLARGQAGGFGVEDDLSHRVRRA